MADDSAEDRNLPASQRRIDQAREEGNLPRSRELVSAAVLMAGVGFLWMAGPWMTTRLREVMRDGLMLEPMDVQDVARMLSKTSELMTHGLVIVLALGVAAAVLAVAAGMAVGGINYAPKAFAPQFNRLNPLSGLKRMLSVDVLGELMKSLLKVAVIGVIGGWLLMDQGGDYAELARVVPGAAGTRMAELLRSDVLWMMLPMLVLVALDVPWVIWRYNEKLKMTAEEFKQEMKEADGDPHVKGRIRALQRQAARKRMMDAVPKADVIVTNPTHYSVALKYDDGRMGAPSVVAKGQGELALRIREVAQQHGVPQMQAPMLARALYRHVALDKEVPASLYAAVAQVLAYVYQLKSWRAHGGPVPVVPASLPVPQDMDIPDDERGLPDPDELDDAPVPAQAPAMTRQADRNRQTPGRTNPATTDEGAR